MVGLVRNEVHLRSPRAGLALRAGDILVLEAEPEALADALATLGIRLDAAVTPADADAGPAGDSESPPGDAAPGTLTCSLPSWW